MVGIGPFYHGSNSKFNFKKDFDFAKGVGVIYLFANANKHAGIQYAKYVGRDFRQSEAYLYEVWLKPSAKIVDLTQWNETTQELARKMDELFSMEHMRFNNRFYSFSDKETWLNFANCIVDPCLFDMLDFNEEFINLLKSTGIDGLYFMDGLDEIEKHIPEKGATVPAVVLLNTNVIDKVNVYEIETYGDKIEKITEQVDNNLFHKLIKLILEQEL